jgi:hypothetical protein
MFTHWVIASALMALAPCVAPLPALASVGQTHMPTPAMRLVQSFYDHLTTRGHKRLHRKIDEKPSEAETKLDAAMREFLTPDFYRDMARAYKISFFDVDPFWNNQGGLTDVNVSSSRREGAVELVEVFQVGPGVRESNEVDAQHPFHVSVVQHGGKWLISDIRFMGEKTGLRAVVAHAKAWR